MLKVVAPAIDGPNVALVIRFEREGEERLARWLGDGDWRERDTLHRLFESADDPRRLRPRRRRCSSTFAVFNDPRPAGGRAGHRDVLAGVVASP